MIFSTAIVTVRRHIFLAAGHALLRREWRRHARASKRLEGKKDHSCQQDAHPVANHGEELTDHHEPVQGIAIGWRHWKPKVPLD